MRLFIAIEIPSELQSKIFLATEDLRKNFQKMRWVPSQNLHLTLKFLGEVSQDKVSQVEACMDRVVRERSVRPFDLGFCAAGAFPSARRPRVIWVGVTEGSEIVSELAKALDLNLEGLGFQSENRTFAPHLTLGRARVGRPIADLERGLESLQKTKFAEFKVRVISLIESFLSPSGAVYQKVHEVELH